MWSRFTKDFGWHECKYYTQQQVRTLWIEVIKNQKLFHFVYFKVCMNKPANEICTCFQAIPSPNAACNPQTELKGATACNDVCQKTWGICSVALKDAGPLVDKCKCDCSKTSTTPIISTGASSGRRHFINLRNFHNFNNNMRN